MLSRFNKFQTVGLQAAAAAMTKRSTKLNRVFVVGVGMTKFEKPGRRENFDYPVMVKEAVDKALKDAKIAYQDIQQACVGYVYGDSTSGQRALYEVGMSGIPVYNVNNNCSTGSTALLMAKQFIEGGVSDCVLAVGFEKMQKGSLPIGTDDRASPLEKHVIQMSEAYGFDSSPVAAQIFGNAGKEHMQKYGTREDHFVKIAYKNHMHSTNNEYSQFQDKYTEEQIKSSPHVFGPLTKLQCCPTSDGAAAAVVMSQKFVEKYGLEDQAVEILALVMSTDKPSTFEGSSAMRLAGYDMSKASADKAYQDAGCSPQDVDVVELHDCFSANELVTYEALGLCEEGKAGEFIDSGNNTYGGKYVINPSGGLISKGHPLGATGLAQCSELCWQLRGIAGPRQVSGAKLALQHNIGLGGAAIVGIYTMGFKENSRISRNNVASASFKSDSIFNLIDNALKKDGENLVNKVKGVFCFEVTDGPDGQKSLWVVDAKNGTGSVTKDGKAKADVTIIMTDNDLVDLMEGKLNPQKAFFQGKLKIKGNMGLAMKLQEFQKQATELKAKL